MPKNPHKPEDNRSTLIILILLAFFVVGAFLLNWHTLIGLLSHNRVPDEKNLAQNQLSPPEQKEGQLIQSQTTPPAGQLNQPSSEPEALLSIDFRNKTCQELDELVQDYFSQLDQQEFMTSYAFKDSSYNHFRQMIASLLANPPIVARETDSLFTILTNTAHFYRILGKVNILMLKDVLLHAGESLEPTLAMFYQWSLSGQECPITTTKIELPLQGLYEYAGFFLNTLGGQAYLFRRESRQRLLIKYYCLLVLDRANARILNRHGIDIVPHLESLTREMEVAETLIYKEQYLRTLRDLQDKYQAYYQVEENTRVAPAPNQEPRPATEIGISPPTRQGQALPQGQE